MRKRMIVSLILVAIAGACAAGDFKDVPKDHWAAESVKTLADASVVKGYPDATFKGDKPVTRYELAVALDGMIRFIQASFQPVTKTADASKPDNSSKSPMESLKAGGFLPPDSPLLKDGNKPVTTDELAAALVAVSTKLIEERVPGEQKPTTTP